MKTLLDRIKLLESEVRTLKRRTCCPKIVFRTTAEFTEPGEEDVLYVDTTTSRIYIWKEDDNSYLSPQGGIELP
jgi:hypothetical protein